ncbi:MAG: hypothetical protein JWL61_5299 [Gemmatimonadetes bacterium]|nr:hypothetical protein [Gemmatimonadota bacterium]
MSRTWLVRKSRFPFHALGEPLGTVVARDHDSADAVASTQFKRPFTIEPAPRDAAAAPAPDDTLDREIPMRRRPAVRSSAAAMPRTPRRFTGGRE